MKKYPTNLKLITFTLAFVVASFAFVQSAYAATYVYGCNPANGGGNLITTVGLQSAGPFPIGSSTSVGTTTLIESWCTERDIIVTMKNHTNSTTTLFSGTISSGSSNHPSSFTPVTISPGTYYVTFETSVDEPVGNPVVVQTSTTNGGVCGASQITSYVPKPNTSLGIGLRVHTDLEMLNVLTGQSYIVDVSTGTTYTMDSAQGTVNGLASDPC